MTEMAWFNWFLSSGDLLTDEASWNLHDPCVQPGEDFLDPFLRPIERVGNQLTGVDGEA